MQRGRLRRAGLAAVIAAGGVLLAGASPALAGTFTVTTTADTGAGSLRQAITAANAHAGHDAVAFAIPGSGAHTIHVTSAPLPVVTSPLKIDGTTQPGFAGIPLVRLDNATGLASANGIDVTAGNSQILGLSVTGFGGAVFLHGASGGSTVSGNRLGLTPSGSADGNVVGVAVSEASASNVVGGTTAGERNVISGNGEGVVVIGGSPGTRIQGNFVGVGPGGDTAVPNTNAGIRVADGAKNTTVGGTASGAGNVISANGGGLNINGAGTTGTVVAGNRVGTNASGATAIPNRVFGIAILGGATATTIGGTTAAARNVIAGNTGVAGVSIGGIGTSGTLVAGNFIGTTRNGAAALPNGDGVVITNGATANTVGGDRSTARNLISGNTSSGVVISGRGTNDNVVAGNDIGPNLAGTAALPNIRGVFILFGASHNTVGGSTAARRNVLSGNTFHGVDVELDGADDNRISANYIGTTPDGASALANGFTGVQIAGGPAGNTVGGTTSGERNVISGNGSGVSISESPSTVVAGNVIGLAAGGTAPLGNRALGVVVSGAGAQGTRIGGTTRRERNVISGNLLGGIRITNNATGTTVLGNLIGTDADGLSPIPNAGDGVALERGAGANTIGGTASGTGNTIAFNGGDGVSVDGTAAPTNGDAILRNAMFDNAQLGISLQGGGNDAQAAPVITSVTTTATATTIKGALAGGPPKSPFRIEGFAGAACDGSGAGEGARFLGSRTITTDAAGNGTFTLNVAPLASGQVVTATATRGSGPQNTSPFSACVAA